MKKGLLKVLSVSFLTLLSISCSVTVASNTNSSNANTSDNIQSDNGSITTSENQTTNTVDSNTTDSVTSNNVTSNSSSSSHGTSSTGGGSTTSSAKPVVDAAITKQGNYIDACYATFKDNDASKCKVEYKLSFDATYQKLDQELIRSIGNGEVRFDAVGLKAGYYDFKITTSASKVLEMKNIKVTSSDRSGYAFYKAKEGVGAYNLDGTLKSKAVVVYVNEANKNTVTANGKTGIAAIIKGNTNGTPLCVRVIGRIVDDTRDSSGKYQGKYEKIKGLTDKPTSDGTYFNMLDVGGGKNITLEGIGDDAEIYQWGMSWNKCSSIEVKNLTYSKYTDDACGVAGDTKDPSKYTRFFIHNNRFNVGENLYNDTPEHDKAEGDGSTDVKGVSYATYCYNSYYSCHKTGLVGGGDSDLTSNLTFHHNYYSKCYSRLPLGRRANMHYYNNYYESTTSTCMDLRANAYVFSEANYFYKCNNPVKIKSAACKSFNDIFESCKGDNKSTKVTSRDQKVSNSCAYGSSFDTDANNFYYDAAKKVSKVNYLTDAKQAKIDALNYSGPGKINPSNDNAGSGTVITTSSSTKPNTSSSKPNSSSSTTSQGVVTPNGGENVFNAASMEEKKYTSNIKVGEFEVAATSAKPVDVAASNDYTSFNKEFTKVLKTGGGGSKDYRSISFTLKQNATVKVYARSTGTSERTVEVAYFDTSSAVDNGKVNSTAKELSFTLSKGKYFVRSTGSSIEIAAIVINY